MSSVEDEVHRAYTSLYTPDDVVEIRAFRGKQSVSGYFNDADSFVESASVFDDLGYQVYATLNPVDPALFARAANQVKAWPRSTTTDNDILSRRWLPLDFDPDRPSGVSSSENPYEY